VKHQNARTHNTAKRVFRQEAGESIRARIRQLYVEKGFTRQEDFAGMVGADQATVQRWISDKGAKSVPDGGYLAIIAGGATG